MPDELLTIGRFARLARLSVKRLRHYDETGLLPPAYVDPHTGYRRYTAGQARRALMIAMLRDADVPLPAVAAIIDADDAARPALLAAERARLAARIARDTERLALLDRLAGPAPGYDVTVGHVPERALTVVSGTADVDGVGAHVGRLIGELLAVLRTTVWTGPVWGLYPLDPVDGMTIAVGAETPGGTRVLSAGPVATTTHEGPYSALPMAYQALLAWVHERGLRPAGEAREEYLVAPGEAGPDDLLTRVSVPLVEENR